MEGWRTTELGNISSISYGYTEKASQDPVGPRFLRITDLQDDHVDWDAVPYCKIGPSDLAKYRLSSGDIVFARTGATTGTSFLVKNPPETVFASYLIRLRPVDPKLLPEFVSLFFQTATYWDTIKEGVTGSAQGGFNASKLAAMKIPVPPLPEQRRVVGILAEAFEGIATAKRNVERCLAAARDLSERTLQSIFAHQDAAWAQRPLAEVCSLLNGEPIARTSCWTRARIGSCGSETSSPTITGITPLWN